MLPRGPSDAAAGAGVAPRHLRQMAAHTLVCDVQLQAHVTGHALQDVVQVAQAHDHVNRLRRPLEAQASAQELFEIDAAADIAVNELEQTFGLRHVHVNGLEELFDLYALQVRVELLKTDVARVVPVQGLEEAAGLAQLLQLPDLARALDCAFHKRGGHDVHHHEQREGRVEEEPEAHPRRYVVHHGAHDVVPIHASCQPLKEGKHSDRHVAVPLLKLWELQRIVRLDPSDGRELGEVYTHNVQHDHDQTQRPHKRLGRPQQATHKHLEIVREPHHVKDADCPDRAQNAHDAKQLARYKRVVVARGQQEQDLLEYLREDEERVE
mmetsp:Transcript_35556/g.91430  ORF Transcript_35556/g.91430 Transcript_35556/m.91430 type:complete len:324 (+) Transcript_35556:66-1037(+)